MATGRPLLSDLRLAVRDNLDESTAAQWTDVRLNRCLTRAADAVLLEVRKARQDYVTTVRTSTDGSVSIYGVTFDTSTMKITAGSGGLVLPPDCLEIRRAEVVTAGYETVRIVTGATISDREVGVWREISNQSATSLSPGNIFYVTWIGDAVAGGLTASVSPISSVALDLRWYYVSASCIVTTAGVPIRAFTTDTDELRLPHPLYMAVEEVATWRAHLQDHDPMGGAWEAAARTSVARFIGSASRQSQDPVVVQGLFE